MHSFFGNLWMWDTPAPVATLVLEPCDGGGIKAIDREEPLTCLTGQVYVLLKIRLKR